MALEVGLQLISVDQHLISNPIDILHKIRELGYRNIEFCNHEADKSLNAGFDMDPETLRKLVDDLGFKNVGVQVHPFNMACAPDQIRFHKALGTPVITSAGYFYNSSRMVDETILELNEIGELCRKAGIVFAYHNGMQEFVDMPGGRIIDRLVKGTDPALVNFQLDTYWVYQGSADPAEEIDALKGRVTQLHQKDLPKEEAKELFYQRFRREGVDIYDAKTIMDVTMRHEVTEIGEGVMDVQGVVNAGLRVGATDIILEHDGLDRSNEGEVLASLKKSLCNFARFDGVVIP